MRPRRPWLAILNVFLVFTVLGLSKCLYLWLDDLARAKSANFEVRLIEEMTGAYVGALVFLGLVRVVRRWPFTLAQWRTRFPLYAGVVVAAGALATTLMWGTRVAIFPLFGLGPYDYGIMRFRYPMEFAIQAPNLVLVIVLIHGWYAYRESRDRELHASRLEAELGRARLERLEAQLEPHFLFNALNGISSVMYQDPDRADRMLGRLADLLRLGFSATPAPEVPLADELEWLGWYLEIMQLRFGPRLTVVREIDPGTLPLAVPRLVLQPLVENALKHGAAARAGPATVIIRARRVEGRLEGRLELAVLDDGPGPATASGNGIGLANTRERLATLHGASASLTLAPRAGGGAEARIELPARLAERRPEPAASTG